MTETTETNAPPCQCPIPEVGTEWFWCDTHQCRKSPSMRQSCATNVQAFTAWQEGRGPGRVVTGTPQVSRPASAPPGNQHWWRLLPRFVTALMKHAQDWFRKCSRREIHDRLAICQTCTQFTGTACAECGCPVNLEKRFRNKLAWRSESCPQGKWPALSRTRWGKPPQPPHET